jgi:hypothetical protein
MNNRVRSVILSEDSMILRLTTVRENDAVIPLLAKEGPGAVDYWATTPYPSSFGGGEPFSWQRRIHAAHKLRNCGRFFVWLRMTGQRPQIN